MPSYVAIIEDAGPDTAIGVWFPDLPGCFSAGDTLDDALRNAPQAIALYAEALEEVGKSLPRPRSLQALRNDPDFATDIQDNMVAVVARQEPFSSAAE